MDILPEMPEIVRQYALYYRNIKGRAPKTVNEYCSDLRTFFRFMKHFRGYVSQDTPMEEIPIDDIDLEFIRSITTMDIFEFMNYAADGRSNMSSTRQRKSSSLKSFFNYLTVHEGLLDSNPTENLTPPKKAKTLPRYLTLEQSRELLNAVDGPDKERDYCILTLFLNCGMRLSELVSINMSDVIHNNSTLRIVGKGSKERIVYLNDACLASIDAYVRVRPKDDVKDKNALFISNRGTRISPKRGILRTQAAAHGGDANVPIRQRGYSRFAGYSGPRKSRHYRDLHAHLQQANGGSRKRQPTFQNV